MEKKIAAKRTISKRKFAANDERSADGDGRSVDGCLEDARSNLRGCVWPVMKRLEKLKRRPILDDALRENIGMLASFLIEVAMDLDVAREKAGKSDMEWCGHTALARAIRHLKPPAQVALIDEARRLRARDAARARRTGLYFDSSDPDVAELLRRRQKATRSPIGDAGQSGANVIRLADHRGQERGR